MMADFDFSRPDWRQRIREGSSLMPDRLPSYGDARNQAIRAFNKLRLPDVVGMPTMRDAAGDWFRDFVGALFGSLNPDSGEREIREGFVLVPKKNGKTSYAAGIMLTALLLNERPRAELILTGPTQETSDLAFGQIEGMIEADPEGFLQRRMHVQRHLKAVTDRKTRATLRIKTFDSNVATGPRPSAILVDELHETAKMSNAANVIGQLRGGMISQPEAFLLFITTQSDRPPAGAFLAELRQARAIRDGRLKGVPMLPLIYEFPEDMLVGGENAPWRDSANWWMVTPNRNRSVRIERLVSDFIAAEQKGQGEVIRWCSQHLNIEIGVAIGSDDWAGAEAWAAAADVGICGDLDNLLARSEVIVVGIDGGGLDDLLGLAVLGRERVSHRWLLWNKAWCHRIALERRQNIAPIIEDLAAAGDIEIVETVGPDIEAIADTVRKIARAGLLADENAIGCDPHGIGQIVDALHDRGIDEKQIVGVSQGWKLAGAILTTERKLADRTMVHAGQRMMAWCAGNAKVELKGNALLITKQASGKAKIDPLSATFNAVSLMSLGPPARRSAYETHGLLVL
jgi:phage terminase large subunit-like protein